jgi:hypothetical protein
MIQKSADLRKCGGATGIRTPDLLHAISRQPVRRGPSPQASVQVRAPEFASVHAGCGTSALYSAQDLTVLGAVPEHADCRPPRLE